MFDLFPLFIFFKPCKIIVDHPHLGLEARAVLGIPSLAVLQLFVLVLKKLLGHGTALRVNRPRKTLLIPSCNPKTSEVLKDCQGLEKVSSFYGFETNEHRHECVKVDWLTHAPWQKVQCLSYRKVLVAALGRTSD